MTAGDPSRAGRFRGGARNPGKFPEAEPAGRPGVRGDVNCADQRTGINKPKQNMKTSHSIKSLILTAALALGLGASARAAPVTGNQGLLGQVYGTLTYSYIDLDASSTHADNYRLSVNQPLLNFHLGRKWARAAAQGCAAAHLFPRRRFNPAEAHAPPRPRRVAWPQPTG